MAVIAIMLWPLVMSFFASINTPEDASNPPDTYLPHSLSFDNYLSTIHYHAGIATCIGNSLAVAAMTIIFCLVLAVPAGCCLSRFNLPGIEAIFLILLA